MKKEILEIAHKYKTSCDQIPNRCSRYHIIIFSKDGSVAYRNQVPYILSEDVTALIVIHHHFPAVGEAIARSICLTDEGDFDNLTINGWKLFFSSEYIKPHPYQGYWVLLELKKEGRSIRLMFNSVEILTRHWSTVNMCMSSVDDDHLKQLMSSYTETEQYNYYITKEAYRCLDMETSYVL